MLGECAVPKAPPKPPRACRNKHGRCVHRLPLFCFIVDCVGMKGRVSFPAPLPRAPPSAFCPACLRLSALPGRGAHWPGPALSACSRAWRARSVFLTARLVLSSVQVASGWEGRRVESLLDLSQPPLLLRHLPLLPLHVASECPQEVALLVGASL